MHKALNKAARGNPAQPCETHTLCPVPTFVYVLQDAAALPPHLQNEKDPLLRQLAPLHISRDYLYQASERASSRTTTTGTCLAHTELPSFAPSCNVYMNLSVRQGSPADHTLNSVPCAQ